jgi:hypothetical protein
MEADFTPKGTSSNVPATIHLKKTKAKEETKERLQRPTISDEKQKYAQPASRTMSNMGKVNNDDELVFVELQNTFAPSLSPSAMPFRSDDNDVTSFQPFHFDISASTHPAEASNTPTTTHERLKIVYMKNVNAVRANHNMVAKKQKNGKRRRR